MLQPGVVKQESDPPSLKTLVMDPYIIVAAGNTHAYCQVLHTPDEILTINRQMYVSERRKG
jgi:hypothetical protein